MRYRVEVWDKGAWHAQGFNYLLADAQELHESLARAGATVRTRPEGTTMPEPSPVFNDEDVQSVKLAAMVLRAKGCHLNAEALDGIAEKIQVRADLLKQWGETNRRRD